MSDPSLAASISPYISGRRLDLPADGLRSPAIQHLFDRFLPGEHLVIDPIDKLTDDTTSYTVTGTGQNRLFQGMKVSATFRAGDQRQVVLAAEALTTPWTLTSSFPKLAYTLASELQFKRASWRLASFDDGPQPNGLRFSGTLDTAGSLGFFVFLLGHSDETLAGDVDAITSGIPDMRLEGAPRSGNDLLFIKLGPITLALTTQARPPVREGGPMQAGVYMEVTTSVAFTAQGKPRAIPLSAGIYTGSSAIRLWADPADLVSAGVDELGALLNSISLKGLSQGDFKLEDNVKVTELEMIVDPQGSSKLSSVSLAVQSVQSLDLLKRANGQPLCSVQNIQVEATLRAPFSADSLMLSISGEILLNQARIVMRVMVGRQSTQFQGSRDPTTPLSLRDMAAYFLEEVNLHTPELRVDVFELVVEPGRQYRLLAAVSDLWGISLGDQELKLESVSVDWEYIAGGTTTAVIGAVIQLGKATIDISATYDPTLGWTFKGDLAPGNPLDADDLVNDLLYYFNVDVPDFVETISLDTLSVMLQPSGNAYDFIIGGSLAVGDKSLGIRLGLHMRKPGATYTIELSGALTVGAYEFTLDFTHAAGSNRLLGIYHNTPPAPLALKLFVAQNLSSSLADLLPEGLSLELEDALFVFDTTAGATRFLLGLDFAARIGLSNLPLVGKEFPPDASASVRDLRLLVASRAMNASEIVQINATLPQGVIPLPVPVAPAAGPGSAPGTDPVALPAGLTFAAMLDFGGTPRPLALPTSGGGGPGAGAPAPPTAANPVGVTPSDGATWFTLQRGFGPLQLRRVGARYRNGEVWFLLDASLGAAGLTLSLDGLGIGLPLSALSDIKSLRPVFALRGLGIAYESSALAIGGAFLRVQRDGQPDEYDGAAVVKASALTLSALGSYTTLAGQPSMFVYAVLDYPIGGPAFLFVTGLAAGFGYNRLLHTPAIDQIPSFPLVSIAIGTQPASGATSSTAPATGTASSTAPAGGNTTPASQGEAAALTAILGAMQRSIPPSTGDLFLAFGIKFTSFKLIESFALLTVAFGHRIEVDILGMSTYRAPPQLPGEQVDPVAEVQLALKASFLPDEGFLGVSAQLTPSSYILSRNCRLTGGFAFYCWFPSASGAPSPHAGDFVLTLGGYHPSFDIPAHYPRVPRLGLNWQVNDQLSVKAEAYCALVPSAVMAGGLLQAVWSSGNIRVWFNAGADFIIGWRPYHYDAYAFVQVHGEYTIHFFGTHTVSIDASANLHMWGPEFSGVAKVKVSVVSFSVTFGGASQETPALPWDQFQQSFLPAPRDAGTQPADKNVLNPCCTITVGAGLMRKGDRDKGELGVIDPERLVLVTNSAIPSSKAVITGAVMDVTDTSPGIGVAPMNVSAIESVHDVTIVQLQGKAVGDGLHCAPVRKDVPVALWGNTSRPGIAGRGLVAGALCGVTITPAHADAHQKPITITRDDWQYDTADFPGVVRWERAAAVPARPGPPQPASANAAAARMLALAASGFDQGTTQ